MINTKILLSTALLAIGIQPTAVLAYEKGDIIVRAGAALVDPDNGDNPVAIAGGATGFSVKVDDNTQLGLTGTYMLSDRLGLGLLAATPFEHTATLQGADALNGKIIEAKHLPPTLTLQYFFNSPDAAFQPYAGAGINYTTFFDEEALDSTLKGAANTRNVKIDDSVGLALELGFDVLLNDHWVFNASAWYIDLETDASIDSDLGEITADVVIDPFVYMLGLGYKF